MFQRLTQTDNYWVQDFSVQPGDIDYLSNLLLEEERPLPIQDLTLAVMRHRVKQEETTLSKMLSRGKLYKPQDVYEAGERLVFPALDFAAGTVTGLRPGYNPEYGDFQVAEVKLERVRRKLEFAVALSSPHPLNDQTAALLELDPSLSTVHELHQRYGRSVEDKLLEALADQPELMQLFGLWFLKALATEIGPGHLNIVEAVLDIAGGGPLPTSELLSNLDLPPESRPELLEFSLNCALDNDDRFDEVGPAGQVFWYLRRLEPPEVLFPPKRLAYTAVQYDRKLLNLNLRKLEQELDDEWSSWWEPTRKAARVTFTLTYPHRQQGTVPLSSRVAPLFPTSYEAPRIRSTIIDGHSGNEMEAWVVWEGRFVHGLAEWYEENDLPVGAYLHLSPGPSPGTAVIEYDARRPQSEWMRVAQVEGGALRFGMQKGSVSCRYDDMMLIGMQDRTAADTVWIKAQEQDWSLALIMVKLFPELSKLSPQSTVHAKTLYSAVNMVRRCPPGPVFAELVRQPCFKSMGENYWQFNPKLWSAG